MQPFDITVVKTSGPRSLDPQWKFPSAICSSLRGAEASGQTMGRAKVAVWVWAGLVILLLLTATSTTLAQTDANTVPLWQMEPLDRIELTGREDGQEIYKVYEIEPQRLPIGTRIEVPPKEDEEDEKPFVGRAGVPTIKDVNRQALYEITLREDGERYYFDGINLRGVTFYEDLLLLEALELSEAGRFEDSNPYLRKVSSRSPNWPGLPQVLIRVQQEEGQTQFLNGNWEQCFWAWAEEKRLRGKLAAQGAGVPPLHSVAGNDALKRRFEHYRVVVTETHNASIKATNDRIERAADRWIGGTVDTKLDYVEGRRIVARLEKVFPESLIAIKWRREYAKRAQALIDKSLELEQANDLLKAYGALEEAIVMFPDSKAVRAATEGFYERHGMLKVAVGRLPTYRGGQAGWTIADRRCAELLHLPLQRLLSFSPTEGGTFSSQLVESFEKSNINKQAAIKLKSGIRWPSDNKPVTIMDVYRHLSEVAMPGSPNYDPGLAHLLVKLTPEHPATLHVEFDRPQFQAEGWLQGPFARPRIDRDPLAAFAASPIRWNGLGPYQAMTRSPQQVLFLANPVFVEPGKPTTKLVKEIRHATSAARLRALRNQEVDMIDYIDPRHYDQVSKIQPGARMVRRSLPTLHVLQFNYRRPELRNRNLRRAIARTLDRKSLFTITGKTIDKDNRLITGPLPVEFTSFGYSEKATFPDYDPQGAKALMIGVKAQLKSIPVLTLAHGGNETSLLVCREIARSLKYIGLEVRVEDLDERSSFNPADADIYYQTYTINNPIQDLISLLFRDNPSLFEYAADWLRLALIELLQVPNATAARELLPKLHDTLSSDLALVPLWQWYDYFLVADTVQGIAESPPTIYHEIHNWRVKPRYPPAYWETKN